MTETPVSCTAYVRRNTKTKEQTAIGVPKRIGLNELLYTNWIACSSAMFERRVFQELRMPDLRKRQDYAFWIQLLTQSGEAAGLNEPLMIYRVGRKSLSSNKLAAAFSTWTVYRIWLGLPLGWSLWYFANYALRGVLRHFLPKTARFLGFLHVPDRNMMG